MSALRLINETEVTSGVSTVNVTDIFSADFDIYKVDISDMAGANSYWYLRLINSSGSVITTSYDNATLLMRSNNTFVEYIGTNTASMWATSNISYSDGNSGVFYFFNPFSSSSYTFMLGCECCMLYVYTHCCTYTNHCSVLSNYYYVSDQTSCLLFDNARRKLLCCYSRAHSPLGIVNQREVVRSHPPPATYPFCLLPLPCLLPLACYCECIMNPSIYPCDLMLALPALLIAA